MKKAATKKVAGRKPMTKSSARKSVSAARARTAPKKVAKKAAPRKPAAKKAVSKAIQRAPAKAGRKPATKSAVRKKAVAKKPVAKKVAIKKAAAKKMPAKTVLARKTAVKKAAAKKVVVKKVAAPTVAKKVNVATAAKPASTNRLAMAPKPVPPVQRAPPPSSGPVSPEVAIQHFRELLRAKQERVSQGPSYPSANAFTGRNDGATAPAPHTGDDAPPAPAAGTPESETSTDATRKPK